MSLLGDRDLRENNKNMNTYKLSDTLNNLKDKVLYFHSPLFVLQDLQDEVEKHRDMYLSLDSAGKKLVSGLDTQEDATLLSNRLEEMNQRWSYLKAKSIAIRCVTFLVTLSPSMMRTIRGFRILFSTFKD